MKREPSFEIPPQIYNQYQMRHQLFFDQIANNAIEQGEAFPMMVLNKGDNRYFFPMTFKNEQEKDEMLMMVKCIAHKLDVTHTYFCTEAWMSNQKGTQPSLAPDRRESIICVLWVKNVGGAMLIWEMIRDETGKLIEVKQDHEPYHISTGLLTHLCGEDLPKKIKNTLKHMDIKELVYEELLNNEEYKQRYQH